MPVAYARVSNAAESDIEFYDRAALRRMDQIGVTSAQMFAKASQEILFMLEFAWWPQYVERTMGATYYQTSASGKTVTSMNPARLVKSSQTLIQLEVYKVVEILFSSLVTDNGNVNEKDLANHKFAQQRFQDEWQKALQLSSFYDTDADGTVTKYEENYQADVNYFSGDRRYF